MDRITVKARREAMIKLYLQKTPIALIANSFEVDSSYVYRVIKKEIDEGRIEKVKAPRKNARDNKLKLKTKSDIDGSEIIQKVELKDVTECEPIKCTENVRRHCRYGGATGGCNFLSVTGKCRTVTNEALNFKGCSKKACIRFQKIDKEHPAYLRKKKAE